MFCRRGARNTTSCRRSYWANSRRFIPTRPQGIVFPGDPGIPSTLAPTKWTNFAPRFGFAYSPGLRSTGCCGKIFGGAGKTSIRAGFGVFYSAFEGLSAGIMSACAPYGYDYDSTGGRPLFNEPFVSATTGLTQRTAFSFPDSGVRRFGSNPEQLGGLVEVRARSREIQRSTPATLRLTPKATRSRWSANCRQRHFCNMGYVGSQAHHCWCSPRPIRETRRRCLSVSQPSEVMPGTRPAARSAKAEFSPSRTVAQVVARGPFGPDFDGITYQKTIGFSNYNALEVSLRHSSRSLESDGRIHLQQVAGRFLQPVGSGVSLRAALTKAISAFDLRHNFVVSYRYRLPFATLLRGQNRWTEGWWLSGITRLDQRPAGHALQQHRQLAAWLHAQRHQQQWRRHAGVRRRQSEPSTRIRATACRHSILRCSACPRWARLAMRRAASSTARAWRISTWPCRRSSGGGKPRCCSSAWRRSTSSTTRSFSERPR